MHLHSLIQVTLVGAGFIILPLTLPGVAMPEKKAGRAFFEFGPDPERVLAITSMALSPKGDMLICTSIRHGILAFETATAKKVFEIQHRKKGRGFWNVIFQKEGDRFAGFCDDEGLQIREAKTGRCLQTIPKGMASYGWSLRPDSGDYLVGSDRRHPSILRFWNWKDAQACLQLKLDPPGDPSRDDDYAVACSPDGKVVATAGVQCPFDTWDIVTGKRLHRFTGPNPEIKWLTYAPDGKTIASASHKYDEKGELKGTWIELWDAKAGTSKRRLPIGERIWQVRYSPDGKFLACCSRESPLIRFFDPQSGKPLFTIDTKEEFGVHCFVFTPDSKRLFTGSETGIRQWDLSSRAEIRITGNGDTVNCFPE